MIARIQRRLVSLNWTDFVGNFDESDLAAFRLMKIGEASRKLPDALKARHPTLPWPAIVAMRKVISHDYLGVDEALIWHTAQSDLPSVAEMCHAELARLDG